MKPRLFHYWRSSSSWRVRWAFALKGIECEFVSIDLTTDESEGHDHLKRNPAGYVPVVEFLDGPWKGRFLGESLAIIEWAEETRPEPSLFSGDAFTRARIRQLAEIVNSGTQPFQNPNVQERVSANPDERKWWCQDWIKRGLHAYEGLVRETAAQFSVGGTVTLADLCLIPQCHAAERYEVALDPYPTIARIYRAALETKECQASHPEKFR